MENFKPEREITISEFVGGTLESHAKTKGLFEAAFKHHERFRGERDKSQEELELVDVLNLHLKEFTESFGGSFVTVPEANIHLIDLSSRELSESRRGPLFTDGVAAFNPLWQGIAVHHPTSKRSLPFAINIVHEMLHFQSFQSVNAKDNRPELRRLGLNVYNTDGSVARFHTLDEAVVVELGKRFDRQFFEDIPYTQPLVETRNNEIAKSKERPLSADVEKILDDVATLETEILPDDRKRVRIVGYSYPNERKDLWALIDRVEGSLGGSKNREELFGLFARSVLSGRLLPLARVLERALGKGAFRIVGEQAARRSESNVMAHEAKKRTSDNPAGGGHKIGHSERAHQEAVSVSD